MRWDENRLLMHWKGPFEILERKNGHDYRVQLKSRVKAVPCQYVEEISCQKQGIRVRDITGMCGSAPDFCPACESLLLTTAERCVLNVAGRLVDPTVPGHSRTTGARRQVQLVTPVAASTRLPAHLLPSSSPALLIDLCAADMRSPACVEVGFPRVTMTIYTRVPSTATKLCALYSDFRLPRITRC